MEQELKKKTHKLQIGTWNESRKSSFF